MAWIEKRGKKTLVVWREPDGTKKARAVADRREGRTVKAEVEAELLRGSYVTKDRRDEPFIEYLQAVYAGDLSIRAVTRTKYEGVIRLHLAPRLGRVPVGELEPGRMRRLFAELHTEAGEWNAWEAFKITRRACRQAVAEGLLHRDPLAGVRVPAPRRKGVRVLTPQEVASVAEEAAPWLQAAIYVSAYGGLSIGELGGLQRADLDGDRLRVERAVSTPKGRPEIGPPKADSRRRVVTLPEWVATILREHILAFPGEYVFQTPAGAMLTHSNVQRFWKAACAAAGVQARFHDLRHTAVALLIEQGAHPKLIQSRMGHSSITMTMDTYGHLFPTADAELAASLEKFSPGENTENKVVELHAGN
jgi:integrase